MKSLVSNIGVGTISKSLHLRSQVITVSKGKSDTPEGISKTSIYSAPLKGRSGIKASSKFPWGEHAVISWSGFTPTLTNNTLSYANEIGIT